MAVGMWVDIVGAVFFVVLGVAVALIRPRRRANVAFAVFAASFGLGFVPSNLAFWVLAGGLASAAWYLAGACWFVAFGSLLVLAATFPTPLTRRDRLAIAIGVAAALAPTSVLIAFAVVDFLVLGEWSGLVGPVLFAVSVQSLLFVALVNAMGGVLLMWAVRARPGTPPRERSQLVLMSAGLATFVWLHDGSNLLNPPVWSLVYSVALVPLGASLVLWLWTGARTGSAGSIRLVLFSLATMLLGMLSVVGAGDWRTAASAGGFGVSRMVAVLILAYAIVRHQLLGIDVKIRWTISRSALASVFIAVFFVASEAAQEFFGDALGSQYVGIIAAGLLVFALAPLSRLADRLAEKAIPVDGADAQGAGSSAVAGYAAAVRAAMRDGALTRREEMHLADVAENLGIGHRQALEIRGQVEKEGS